MSKGRNDMELGGYIVDASENFMPNSVLHNTVFFVEDLNMLINKLNKNAHIPTSTKFSRAMDDSVCEKIILFDYYFRSSMYLHHRLHSKKGYSRFDLREDHFYFRNIHKYI